MTHPTEEQKRAALEVFERCIKNSQLPDREWWRLRDSCVIFTLDHQETIRALLSPAPVDADLDDAVKWAQRKLYLHRAYVDTFKDNECPWTIKTVKHKRKQIRIIETLIHAATKNMGDAVTREDTGRNRVESNHLLPDEVVASPATSPKCEAYNQCMMDEGEYEKKCVELIKSRDGLVKALETIKNKTDTAYHGDLMKYWDEIRNAVEDLKGASLPREMFEGLMEEINDCATDALSEHRKNMGGE